MPVFCVAADRAQRLVDQDGDQLRLLALGQPDSAVGAMGCGIGLPGGDGCFGIVR